MSKILKLQSSEGEDFEVEDKVVELSETIKNMVEDDSSSTTIPLPNVLSKTLTVVVNYLKKHTEEGEATSKNALDAFDKELVCELEVPFIYKVIQAADSLKIQGLLDISCQRVADMIKGKTTEEMREILQIENDMTPEEEEEARRENAWNFE